MNAAIKHAFDCPCQDCEPRDEWMMTREHIDPQDPMVAGPRWREALLKIANYPFDVMGTPEQDLSAIKQIAREAVDA